jgi:hypothetical protein
LSRKIGREVNDLVSKGIVLPDVITEGEKKLSRIVDCGLTALMASISGLPCSNSPRLAQWNQIRILPSAFCKGWINWFFLPLSHFLALG